MSLEQGSKVGAFTEIKNTLFGPGSSVHSGFVGDSIVGKNCRIGIFVCTSNVRLDKSTIKVDLPGGETADTGFSYFGSIIGDNVSLGVRVTLMPGVVIGSKTLVGPSSIVMKSLPHESLYYSRFSEIVEKKNKV